MKTLIPDEIRGEILAAGMSLYNKAVAEANVVASEIDLSDLFNGFDEFMRMCEIIAERFALWACDNVDYESLEEPWLYVLGNRFGNAVIEVLPVEEWQEDGEPGCMVCTFNESHCEKVAVKMGVQLK